MAKALVLSDDILAAPVEQPRASQTARPAPSPAKAAKPAKGPTVPLQIRIPAAEAKAIKRAMLDSDHKTISDFMLACFHAFIKK